VAHSFRGLLPSLALALAAGCSGPAAPPETAAVTYTPDPHSYAKPAEARVTAVSLDLTPDFSARTIAGTARLAVTRSAGASSLVLDIRDLAIARVTDAQGAALKFEIGESRPFLGQPLTIALSPATDAVVIEYRTSPTAAAVQWLAPAQTSGKKLPFLFTQGQAVLTRTWVPTQDSPGIRQTYDATIHAPAGMRAVMSAEDVSKEGEKDNNGRGVYRYRMTQPIPPYLIALAVGDLAFKPIGKTTGVYAEPSVVDRAASEFVEVDQMIAAAEKLYGPYRWGRYDLLVLPPSFPFGGMENPRLTFATPTILAGDRSLVSLVAHELAHSWSGNLVTNANWNDFWINEGFTVYLEGRIMEELRGRRYADMLRQLGRQDLDQAIVEAGGSKAADTHLRLALDARDPDDGMTNIAYEKGAAFLQTIEAVVGRERLDAFLRAYFERFAFQPMTSEHLLRYMNETLFKPGEVEKVDVQAWVYGPGLPSNAPPVKAEAFAAVDAEVARWARGERAAALATSAWSTQEWLHFLRGLPQPISAARLGDLDRTFKLSASGNSEILFAWLEIAIRERYEPAFPALERFLLSQGRRKFLRPLYEELAKTDWGRAMAARIYRQARPTYHSVSVGTIDGILKWQEK